MDGTHISSWGNFRPLACLEHQASFRFKTTRMNHVVGTPQDSHVVIKCYRLIWARGDPCPPTRWVRILRTANLVPFDGGLWARLLIFQTIGWADSARGAVFRRCVLSCTSRRARGVRADVRPKWDLECCRDSIGASPSMRGFHTRKGMQGRLSSRHGRSSALVPGRCVTAAAKQKARTNTSFLLSWRRSIVPRRLAR